MNDTNPAARAVRFIESYVETRLSNDLVRDVLSKMYKVESDDTAALFGVIAEVWRIPVQVRQELVAIENFDAEPFNGVLDELEAALVSLSLDGDSLSFQHRVDDNLIRSLKMINSVLKKDIVVPQLHEDKRRDLIDKLDKLITDLFEAELDQDFTSYASDRLNAIRYAIQQYDLVGPDEVIRKVETMFGGLVCRSPAIKQDPGKKSFAKRMAGIGASVLMAFTVINQGLEIVENVMNLLGDDNPSVQVEKNVPGADKKIATDIIDRSSNAPPL